MAVAAEAVFYSSVSPTPLFLPVSSSSSSSGRPLVRHWFVPPLDEQWTQKILSSLSLIGESERDREEAWRIKNYMARWIPTTLAFFCVCLSGFGSAASSSSSSPVLS